MAFIGDLLSGIGSLITGGGEAGEGAGGIRQTFRDIIPQSVRRTAVQTPFGAGFKAGTEIVPTVQKLGAALPAPTGGVLGVSEADQAPAPEPTPQATPTGGGGVATTAALPAAPVAPAAPEGTAAAAPALVQETAEEAAAKQAEEEAATQARIAEETAGIETQFEPIFSELDRQIGVLPEKQKTLEDQLSELVISELGGVRAEEERQLAGVEQSKEEERAGAKGALRGLEQNIRDILRTTGLRIGAAGAGDSSAIGRASEIIAKQGLKSRGGIQETLGKGLNKLSGIAANVKAVAGQQVGKVNQFKTQKMFEIKTEFQDKIDQLQQAKATASADKQGAINAAINQEKFDLRTRIQQLDDQVTAFKQGIETWQLQRTGAIEDFVTQVAIAGTGGGAAGGAKASDFQIISDDFGNFFRVNKLTGTTEPLTTQFGQVGGQPEEAGIFDKLTGAIGGLFGGGDEEEQQ